MNLREIYIWLSHTATETVKQIIFNISGAFDDILLMVTALYFIIIALLWISGRLGDFTTEFITSVLLAGVLYEFAVDGTSYMNAGVMLFITTPSLLAEHIAVAAGIGYGGVFDIVDETQMSVFQMIDNVGDQSSMFGLGESIGLYIGGWLLAITLSASTFAFFAFMFLSLFGVRILLIAGVVPVFLASFRMTRHIFWSWLKQVINYALLQVFAVIIMCLTAGSTQRLMEMIADRDMSEGIVSELYFGALFLGVLQLWLLWKAAEFASALTSGVMTSFSGVGGTAMGLGRMGANAYNSSVGGAVNTVGQRAGHAISNAAGAGARRAGGALASFKNLKGIKS